MKPLHPRLLALLALSTLFVAFARADETARARILKERDAVLSQIVSGQEARFASGMGDEEAVASARLALFAFRRDTAAAQAEKIRQQELIVRIHEKKLATLRVRENAGLVGRETILLATDSLLEAQQVLEELRPDAKQG